MLTPGEGNWGTLPKRSYRFRCLAPFKNFPLEQSPDDTLHSVFDKVIKIDSQVVHLDVGLTFLHFGMIKDRLY